MQLSDDPSRKFSVDSLEDYISKSKDYTPIFYLAEKFLGDKQAKQDAALSELRGLMAQLQPLMKKAGL